MHISLEIQPTRNFKCLIALDFVRSTPLDAYGRVDTRSSNLQPSVFRV